MLYECRLCMDLPEANFTSVRDLYSLWVACPCSLIPKPLPDFSPRLHDKIWEWPGEEATALVSLSWSAIAKRVLAWIVFVPQASHQRCALAVALHQRNSGLGIAAYRMHRCMHKTTWAGWGRSVFIEIFKDAFTVYGRKHTHNLHKCSNASVGFAPITIYNQT